LAEIIGLRAFAKLTGVKLGSIQDAIDAGRLTAVVTTPGGRKLRHKEALAEWKQCHPTEENKNASLNENLRPANWGVYKTQQEALLARERRLTLSLEREELEGKLHRDEDVEAVWADILIKFRARILGIPTKAAPIIAAIPKPNAAKIQAVIEAQMREALTELAQYDKGKVKAARAARTKRS